jgi:Asp-tRNA(Asn)/Glu-tRNA(Gln) amidotransferase A subunit family amidase
MNIAQSRPPAPNQLSATQAAEAIRAGRLTSEMLVAACLERIGARESEVSAWAHVDAERVLAEARRCDSEAPKGPLHGLPVGIKDVLDTAGMPTKYGSSIYHDHVPTWDAACVAQIRTAGGIIMGKTVTTEFAGGQPGPTRHPLNPAFTPGGSSSGSSAAVRDQMVPLTIGTQTFGSVIRPAAYCGIVGYKPTFGAISRTGLRVLSESFDTIGLMARCVDDVALFAPVLTGYEGSCRPQSLRLAVCRSPQWPHARPETITVLDRAVERLRQADFQVMELDITRSLVGVAEAADVVCEYEISRAFTYEWMTHKERLSKKFISEVEAGRGRLRRDYEAAQNHLEEARRNVSAVFADYNAILTPSAPGEAPVGLENTGSPIFNKVWTALHLPCMTIPAGLGPNGLPVGLQIVGARHQDSTLVWLSGRLEASLQSY